MTASRNFLKSLLFATCATTLLSAQTGEAATAKEFSCQIKDAFLVSKSDGIDAFETAMHTLSKNKFAALHKSFGNLPDSFDDGRVVEISRFDDLLAEYMIILNSPKTANIYFRVIFEKHHGREAAIHMHYNGNLKELLAEWPILGSPKLVDC